MLRSLVAASALVAGSVVSSAAAPNDAVALTWVDATQLTLAGRPFPSLTGNATYTRLPPSAQAQVPQYVWEWSQCSSGIYVAFTSNASSVSVSYTLRNANWTLFSNFPPTGFSGVDLYRFDEGNSSWRWIATAFEGLQSASHGGTVLEAPLFSMAEGWPVGPYPAYPTLNATYRYRLHLPSYNGVTSVSVGVPTGASLLPDAPTETKQATTLPVAYYGTSITQGGLTSRPGQTYVSLLTRALDVPVLNLGFCGACLMESSVGAYLSTIPSSLFVIDCGWNMNPALIANNTEPLVRQIRASQPSVPILLVEPSDYRPAWILGDSQFNNTGRRIELAAAYARLVAAGVNSLYYVKGGDLFAGIDTTDDPTFEGVHPLDHGHLLIATALQPVIGGILGLPGYARIEAGVVPAREAATSSPPSSSGSVSPPSPVIPLTPEGNEHLAAGSASPRIPAAKDALWVPATSLFMRGRAFNDTPTPFNRLPAAAHGVVRDAVWGLSLNSAGLLVGFSTASPTLYVNYSAADSFEPMVHFPVSGVSGMEIFAFDDSAKVWRHVQPLQLDYTVNSYSGAVAAGIVPNPSSSDGSYRYLLHLPTYNTAVSIDIGTEPGFSISAADPFTSSSPTIVWYGTSILQGGVVHKSANIFTSRISRALGAEIFNFGFSGNGEMEISVAQFLTTIPNPAVFIVDCK
jgi:hypothetical protein